MRFSLGLLLAAACLCASCSKPPKCYGDLDRDEIYRLAKLLDQGKDPCPELLKPNISVDGSTVSLNGRAVMRRASLPSGTAKRVDPLFTELKLARETYKQLHPAQMFDANTTLVLPGDLDASTGISLIKTAAFAGYPRIHLECSTMPVDFYYAVPMPPVSDEATKRHLLQIVRDRQGGYEARFTGHPASARPTDFVSRDFSSFVSNLGEACAPAAGACAQTVHLLMDGGDFIEVAKLIRAVLDCPGFARRRPIIGFGDSP